APFLLLFSTSLLVFGMSGMLLYYSLPDFIRYMIFILPFFFMYGNNKVISITWKRIAKSKFYSLSTTKNLIGLEAEVVLPVDYKGGVVKISSETPMKYEKIIVKPLDSNSRFERGEKVFICTYRNGIYFVDKNQDNIIKMRRRAERRN
ncbi:MAG: hypothetical protein ACTSQS_11595, partial [Promethearchaeota archaeon]